MIIRTAALLLLTFFISGCADDLPVPVSNKPGKIALIGELTVGETFSIRAGQSLAMGGKEIPIPQGLTVTVKDDEGGVWTLPGVRDELSDTLRTVVVASSTAFIRAGKQYTITTAHQSLGEATAEISIPQPITAALLDTLRMQQTVGPVLHANIRIQDAPGEHYYVIEAVKQPMQVEHEFLFEGQWRDVPTDRILYDSLRGAGISLSERRDTSFGRRSNRIGVYTADPATENVGGTSAAPTLYRRVLLSDKTFQGSAYTTSVSVLSTTFTSPVAQERGRVFLQVKSVSKEYFDFLKRYEVYQPDSPSEPASLQGNVAGGYGMVGGAAKVEWMWVFDTWE